MATKTTKTARTTHITKATTPPAGSDRPQLHATHRSPQAEGTRPSRRMRLDGLVPGIVYGKATPPMAVCINRRELIKFLHARGGEHNLLTLCVEGNGAGKPWEKPVLIKAVQHNPVDGEIRHIDFHAIVLTEHIRVKVPIVLTGEPIGVKQDRGIVEHFLRELEVECLPTQIPKQVDYAIEHLKIGDAIHVKDLPLPAGVKLMTDLESGVASVVAPKEEKPEEAGAAEVTEPEVIREKKPEAEGEAVDEKKEGKDKGKAEAKDEKKEK